MLVNRRVRACQPAAAPRPASRHFRRARLAAAAGSLALSLTWRVRALALSLVPCVAFPTPATADAAAAPMQIYGVIDVSITSQDSGAPGARRRTVLASGLWNNSRIGLRAKEPLGADGLKAIFNLEADIDVTGAASNPDFFNRRSVLGLEGRFGTLVLGREYTPLDAVANDTDALAQAFYGSTLVAFAGDRLTRRVSNALSYTAPPLARDFKLIGTVAAGEGQRPRAWGLSTVWDAEPLYLGAACLDLQGQGVDARQYVVGARLKLGGLTVAGNYLVADYAAAQPRFSETNVGANHRFGANQVFANLQTNRYAGGARGTTLSLAYARYLSSRTQVYLTMALLRNNDRAVFGLGQASTPPPDAPGSNPSAVALGLQHSF